MGTLPKPEMRRMPQTMREKDSSFWQKKTFFTVNQAQVASLCPSSRLLIKNLEKNSSSYFRALLFSVPGHGKKRKKSFAINSWLLLILSSRAVSVKINRLSKARVRCFDSHKKEKALKLFAVGECLVLFWRQLLW